jgi:hypothetical protein
MATVILKVFLAGWNGVTIAHDGAAAGGGGGRARPWAPHPHPGLAQDEEQEADIEASIFEQYLSVCDQGSVDPDT